MRACACVHVHVHVRIDYNTVLQGVKGLTIYHVALSSLYQYTMVVEVTIWQQSHSRDTTCDVLLT